MKSQLDPEIELVPGFAEREIAVREWANTSSPKRVIVLSHGMGEHIDRYSGFAQYANDNEIVVIGANHRGHGEDAPLKGHFGDDCGWQGVLEDLDAVINFAQSRYGVPVILVGHSMGSFIARHYAILNGEKLSGLVLCGSNYQGPLLFQTAKLIAQSQVKLFNKRHPSALLEFLSFGAFNLKVKKPRTAMDWLNSVDTEVDRYIADPLCGFRCTTQFWVDFMSGLAWSSERESLKRIASQLPVLVASGDHDPVSRMGKGAKDLQAVLQSSGIKKVDLKLYSGARHELFLESNRQEFYQDLLNWIQVSTKLDESKH